MLYAVDQAIPSKELRKTREGHLQHELKAWDQGHAMSKSGLRTHILNSKFVNGRDHGGIPRTKEKVSLFDPSFSAAVDSPTLFFEPEHHETNRIDGKIPGSYVEEEGNKNADQNKMGPRFDIKALKKHQPIEKPRSDDEEILTPGEIKNRRRPHIDQPPLTIGRFRIHLLRRLEEPTTTKTNDKREKWTFMRSLKENHKRVKPLKTFVTKIRPQNFQTENLHNIDRTSKVHQRMEYFKRVEEENYQPIINLPFSRFGANKHLENSQLQTPFREHLRNQCMLMLRKISRIKKNQSALSFHAILKWCTNQFKSSQRNRRYNGRLLLKSKESFEPKSKKLHILLLNKWKPFVDFTESLDVMRRIYNCTLEQVDCQQLSPLLIRALKSLPHQSLYVSSHQRSLMRRRAGRPKKAFSILIPSVKTRRSLDETLMLKDIGPFKISGMRLPLTHLKNLKKESTFTLPSRVIHSFQRTTVNLTPSKHIKYRPRYGTKTLASQRGNFVTRSIEILDKKKKAMYKAAAPSYNIRSTLNSFDHPGNRRKQASSSVSTTGAKEYESIVNRFSLKSPQIYMVKDITNNQSCTEISGFLSYLGCKGNSALKTAWMEIKFLKTVAKSLFAIIKDILEHLYIKFAKVYRWIININPPNLLEKVNKALLKNYHEEINKGSAFAGNNTTNKSFVEPNKSFTSKSKVAKSTMIVNKPDNGNASYRAQHKGSKIWKSQGQRNSHVWRHLEKKNVNDGDAKATKRIKHELKTKQNAAKVSHLGTSGLLKFKHNDENRSQKAFFHKRSPRHTNMGERSKNAYMPTESTENEAHAMTQKLLKLMTMTKEYIDRNPVPSRTKTTDGNYDFDMETIRESNLTEDDDINLLESNKPTEADRQLLANIERLTFAVIGHNSENEFKKPLVSLRSRDRNSGMLVEDRSYDITHKPSHKTLPGKRVYLKSPNSKMKKISALRLTKKLQKNKKYTNSNNVRHKAVTGLRNVRLSHGSELTDRRNHARNSFARKVRPRRESNLSTRRGAALTADKFLQMHSADLLPTHKIKPKKEINRLHSDSYFESKKGNKKRRSVDTIDLMDEFRLLWPPLRAKAIDLVDTITNMKTAYDTDIDELSQLVRIGDDYNKDAKEAEERDKDASANLQKATEKLIAEESDFEKFQKQIANEEKLTMDFERKANELNKDPTSLLFAARIIPESKARVSLNDITLGEPMLSVPAPDTALQKLSLDYHNHAGLKSTLLNLKPIYRLSHDENLHMLANDLSEITSRAQLKTKGPARRRRSALPKLMHQNDNQKKKKGKTIHKNKISKMTLNIEVNNKNINKVGKLKKKINRSKRTAKVKDVSYQKPLKKCKQPQTKEGSKTAAINPNDKNAAAKFGSLGMPQEKNQEEKSTSSGNKQKVNQDVIAFEDTPQKSKPSANNRLKLDLDNDVGQLSSESNVKNRKDYDSEYYGSRLQKSLDENAKNLQDKATQNFIKEQEKVIDEPSYASKSSADLQQKKRKNENVLLKDNEPRKKKYKDLTINSKTESKEEQEKSRKRENVMRPEISAENQKEKRKKEEKNKDAQTKKQDKISAANEAEQFEEEMIMKSKPKSAEPQAKNTEKSVKLDKMKSEELDLQSQPNPEARPEKPIDEANNKLDEIATEELGSLSPDKRKDQPAKPIDKANDKLDQLAAKEFDLAINPAPNNPPNNVKTEKAQSPMNSMELSLKVKPNTDNKPGGSDFADVDLKAPQTPPAKNDESSLSNLRKKREWREERLGTPLNRTRRRVIDYNDASFVDDPDVGHVVVGFHGINYRGDQHDVLDNIEEDTDEEDTIVDDDEYGGVDGDNEDLQGENLLDLDVESEYDDDCLDDYEDSMDYDDSEDEGLAGAKRLEDIAPAEASDWERAYAVKQWDDIGADIQLYAAPDRDTPEEIMRYTDPVVDAQKAQMDLIGSGKDLANDLEAELMTPKKDPVIEGLMAPGIRQEEKDTVNEARLLDTIPSLNTIEDVSGVLMAAGRDLQQELKMRDMGVDVDKLLNEGDLDPYTELMGDSISDDLNRKYVEFFGRTSLSAPVQHELRDIVNTRQKADRAFKTLRKSETLVDESILPQNMKTAMDEQLDDSIISIRREQKKQALQGKIFEEEQQAQEADAIRDLEQNNEALIDQRMRQTEQLEEDLKAAASDQVEMAARRSKMLHDLAIQTG